MFAIIVRLDKPEYCSMRLFDRIEGLLVNPFDFERVKKAFASGVMASPKLRFHNNCLYRSCWRVVHRS